MRLGAGSELNRGERHTLDDEVRTQDTHGANTNTRFGSSIGSTETRENDGGGAAHRTEERLVDRQYIDLVAYRALERARRMWPRSDLRGHSARRRGLIRGTYGIHRALEHRLAAFQANASMRQALQRWRGYGEAQAHRNGKLELLPPSGELAYSPEICGSGRHCG